MIADLGFVCDGRDLVRKQGDLFQFEVGGQPALNADLHRHRAGNELLDVDSTIIFGCIATRLKPEGVDRWSSLKIVEFAAAPGIVQVDDQPQGFDRKLRPRCARGRAASPALLRD